MDIFNLINLKKWTLWGSRLFFAALILFGISFFQSSVDSGKLEVNFFDVGQGDAYLVTTPSGQKILIDGGPGSAVLSKIGRALPFFEKEIDLMILTHPHADHLGGLIEVLKRYKVKKILATGAVHTTPEYLEWLEQIKEQKIPMEIAKSGQVIDFGGDVKMEIFYPFDDLSGKQFENLNNTSIVGKLIFGQTSFLFVGDAESEAEEKLIGAGVDLKADVLKVGHHGSKNATSQKFLDAAQPEFAVISVGADNKFGHPSESVLRRLEKAGVKVLRTDEEGDVRMVSDGREIKIEK